MNSSIPKGRNIHAAWAIGLALVFALFCFEAGAAAPPLVSQAISVASPIMDEFGVALQGTDPDASRFNVPVVEGDLVQILQATDGVIYPPDTNGVPDPRNVVLKTLRIGIGASPNEAQPGTFGTILTPRPAGSTIIFVRVFNAPEVEQASFYQDSQLFTVSSVVNEYFTAAFAGAPIALDTQDDDGDGIQNSWETSYGTDTGNIDTDGDGQSDPEELVAGTDPVNENSQFVIAEIKPVASSLILLSWQSESGRTYVVESRENLMGEESFDVVETVNGNGSLFERLYPAGSSGHSYYRVRVSMTPPAE